MQETDVQEARSALRQQVRLKRQALSPEQQAAAAASNLEHVKRLSRVQSARHIALYLSNDGEINTQPLIAYFWQQGKQVYLPVIDPTAAGVLHFFPYTQETKLVANKYGIPEPQVESPDALPICTLDIIFTPLVAFDDTGQRLGMGGGYYDRYLAPWHETGQGPFPIGLAHHCQLTEPLPYQAWDIPLPMIITPEKLWHWETKHKTV